MKFEVSHPNYLTQVPNASIAYTEYRQLTEYNGNHSDLLDLTRLIDKSTNPRYEIPEQVISSDINAPSSNPINSDGFDEEKSLQKITSL